MINYCVNGKDIFYDEKANKMTVFVADSGIGLTDTQKQRLFKRFSQAEQSTHETYGGTGLGLAISRQIAQMMGGDISVASRSGEGSIFVLTFECPSLHHGLEPIPLSKTV